MTIKDLISKHKLNGSAISREMEMPVGSFNNKLMERNSYFFTEAELKKLKAVLLGISKDIQSALKEK